MVRMPIVVLALFAVAAEPAGKPANRLASETSPYLRQHAHNPVDWFPWGPEAFAKAAKENKLIFLSIGYSSCHWCHVMERESFASAAVAKLLNADFVCIKVDREERPDIDDIYITALNMMGHNGGWPLSMFLTPDGKPIIGGTYFPPDDKEIDGQKINGFKTVLRIMTDLWNEKPDAVKKQAAQYAASTARYLSRTAFRLEEVPPSRELITAGLEALKSEFDPEHGGFGRKAREFQGTKFPMPSRLELLLSELARGKSDELSAMLKTTLDHMARGGIFDQIGGGFHRYSTERTWTVPHFEKMLYDNAQLVSVYCRAFAATKDPLYRRVVEETLAFVARELTSPEGAFYSALDADSEGEEGKFYVWTEAELKAVLTADEVALFRSAFSLDGRPNFDGKAFIPVLAKPTEAEKLAALKAKLLAAREQRPRPFLDTKVLTAWNGQMIAAYAEAGVTLREPKYIAAAAKAADFVLKHLRTSDGRLLRTWSEGKAKLNGYLDDSAFLAAGLLTLHAATAEQRWLTEAKAVVDRMVKWHHDPERGGFFYTSHDHEKLFARAKDQFDGAQPSGNSVATRVLVRLASDPKAKRLADETFRSFAGELKERPLSMTLMLTALNESLAQAEKGKAEPPKSDPPPAGGAKRSDAVVKLRAKATKIADDGTQTVTLTLTVNEPWHVYANPTNNEELTTQATTVSVARNGKPLDARIAYPLGKNTTDKFIGAYRVYEGTVEIPATVKREPGDEQPLEVTVKFIACKDGACLLPATVKVTVP